MTDPAPLPWADDPANPFRVSQEQQAENRAKAKEIIREAQRKTDDELAEASRWEAANGGTEMWKGARSSDSRPLPADGEALPTILLPGPAEIDGEFLRVAIGDMTCKVLTAIRPDVLYRRGPIIGTIEGEAGERRFVQMTRERMRHIVDANVRLQKSVVRKDGAVEIDVPCSEDHARLVMDAALFHPRIRGLKRLTTYPVFCGPELTLARPGWNADSGTFFDATPDLLESLKGAGPMVSDDEMRVAIEILEDLVTDFPFANDASRQNFFAMLLTAIIRPAIDGNVPFFLVEASLERTGKTKLIEQVFGEVVLGSPTPAMQLGTTEEEREKRITALLLRGAPAIHGDNIGRRLDSQALASLATSRVFQGRKLGLSEVIPLPNEVILALSGNNVAMSAENAKRTVPIRLQPADDHPETRTDFVHADLSAHVRASRLRVPRVLVSMVETWRVRGRQKGRKPFGGFEPWAEIVGGILGLFGCTDFLDNRQGFVRRSAPESVDREILVAEWAVRFGGGDASATQLLDIVNEKGLFPYVTAGPEGARAARLAKSVLQKLVESPIVGFLVRVRDFGSGSRYFLERCAPSEGSEGSEGV